MDFFGGHYSPYTSLVSATRYKFGYMSFIKETLSYSFKKNVFCIGDIHSRISLKFFILFYVLLFHRFIILHCPQITANVLFTFHLFPPELKYWSNGKWGRGQAVRIVFGSAHKKHLSTLPE